VVLKPLVFVPDGLLRSVPTAETAIAMTFLVMNLEQLLRQLLFVFFAVVLPQKVFQFNRW